MTDIAVAGLLALLLAQASAQEKFPSEDDAWLRFKPGTWIENKVTVEVGDTTIVSTQKQTLKEKDGADYLVEETGTANGKDLPSVRSRKSAGTITGTETVVVDGKDYPCKISAARGTRDDGEVEVRYWMPKGNKYPLKVAFKQKNMEGELTAVVVDEKMRVGDRDYECARLEGKVKFGLSEGTMTVWLNQEIPGGQARAEMSLAGTTGFVKITAAPKDLHIEK
jgi:hypothetical protein